MSAMPLSLKYRKRTQSLGDKTKPRKPPRRFSIGTGGSVREMTAAPAQPAAPSPSAALPEWASELVTLYEANAVNQFILHGNVNDRMVLPIGGGKPPVLGNLQQFLLDVLMPRFDVVLTY